MSCHEQDSKKHAQAQAAGGCSSESAKGCGTSNSCGSENKSCGTGAPQVTAAMDECNELPELVKCVSDDKLL